MQRVSSNDCTVCILPAPFNPPSMPQNTALIIMHKCRVCTLPAPFRPSQLPYLPLRSSIHRALCILQAYLVGHDTPRTG